MRVAFELEEPERVGLIKDVGLPDPDDEHIVKLAIAGHADVIVTHNLKDFPQSALPSGLRVQPPKDFLHDMVTADRARAVDALAEMSARRRRPPQSERDLVDLMLMNVHMSGETARVAQGLISSSRVG